MPPRTRPSTRRAGRAAPSASEVAPSTEPKARTKRATVDHPPASEPPARRVKQRGRSNDESEESARLPGARGKAKRKHETPTSKVAQVQSTIEEDIENEVEEKGQWDTQGTIHLASHEVDTSASSDVAPEDFADAPEVPDEAISHPAPPSPALSGTTARVSDARLEITEPKAEIQTLSQLWKSAWRCINKIMPRHFSDEQLAEHHRQFRDKGSKTELELAPLHHEFLTIFRLYARGAFIDVPEKVSVLAGAPGRSASLLPDQRRTDEVLFLANIAMQIFDVASDTKHLAGLSWETLTNFDETFPSLFVRGIGSGIGETNTTKRLVDLAVSWREQAVLGIFAEKYPEVTGEQALLQLYFTEGEKALRGWDTPGMHDEDVTGSIKIALTESAQQFQNIISSLEEAEFAELKAALEEAFSPDRFRRKLLQWLRHRARELRESFDDRLDGDVDALQRELLGDAAKSVPQIEAAASAQVSKTAVGAEAKPSRTKKKGQRKSTEFWLAMKRANEEPFKVPAHPVSGTEVRAVPPADQSGHTLTGNDTAIDAGQAYEDEDVVPVNDDEHRHTPPSNRGGANVLQDDRGGQARVPSSQMIADYFPRGISNRIEIPKIRKRAFNEPQAGARAEIWDGELESQASRSQSSDRGLAMDQVVRPTQPGNGGKRKPDADEDEDEDGDFQTDTRQIPRKERHVRRTGSARVGTKRMRGADADDEVAEPRSKRQRDDLEPHMDATSRVSSLSTVRENDEDRRPSNTPAKSNEGRQRGAAKLSWGDEEDQVLLHGIEEYRGAKQRMAKILDPGFDRLKVLSSRGRINADLTNRARVLKAQMIRNAHSVDEGLRGRPGLTEIPLKTEELKKLIGAGIDIKDLPEAGKFFR